MAIIALLIGLLLPALAKARAQAKLMEDQTQTKQIHQAWVTWSNNYKGLFPTPGLINRLPYNGQEIPGKGQEDTLQNTTAYVHSVAIAQNYYTPEICVGPTEPNGRVFVKDNYNWEVISVENDIYWDPDFTMKLDSICHASYASIPVLSTRKKTQWLNTSDSRFAAIGNRGPQDGQILDEHITYEIHGSTAQWDGVVCFQDNHVESLHTFFPDGMYYQEGEEQLADNLFKNDGCYGGICDGINGEDSFLAIVKDIYGGGFSPDWLTWDEEY
jgi:hypothetical protein